MKHWCSAATPPCFARYEDGDIEESFACARVVCPARNTLRIQQAVKASTYPVPSLRQEAAARKGGRA